MQKKSFNSRLRLEAIDVFKILYLAYRTIQMNSFRHSAARERKKYLQRMIDQFETLSKYFPENERSNEDTGNSIITTLIQEIEEDDYSQTGNKWLTSIYSSNNNCRNMKEIIIQDERSNRDYPQMDFSILPEKNYFSMAHHLYISRSKSIYEGSCRTCSRDMNRNRYTKEQQVRLMETSHHRLPKCSMKLSSDANYSGFKIVMMAPLAKSRRFTIDKIEFSDPKLAKYFRSNLKRFNKKIPSYELICEKVVISDTKLRTCIVEILIQKERAVGDNGAIQEVISQGYHPLIDIKNIRDYRPIETAPYVRKLDQIIKLITRSCNPYLFVDPDEFLLFDLDDLICLYDLESSKIDSWPLLYVAISEQMLNKIVNDLQYSKEHKFLEEVLFKKIRDSPNQNIVLFEIDPVKFWM
jgi:hypothetical protein